jgi:hypothetical protein
MKMKSAPELDRSREKGTEAIDTKKLPDTSKKSKPTTVSSHNFYNEGAGMGCSCGIDVVYGFTYPVQRSWGTNSKIRHRHIIVYGAHKSNYLQMTVLGYLLFSNLA